MEKLQAAWAKVVGILNSAGDWVALLPIRLILAYEFWWVAGNGKLRADGVPQWFADKEFPFPFSLFPAGFNWFIVSWVEVIAGIALVLGLFTRFWSFSLIIVTIVAIVSTHWPAEVTSLAQLWEGYKVSGRPAGSGNFRIPLLFLFMLIPLVLIGPGKLSVDHLLNQRFGKK